MWFDLNYTTLVVMIGVTILGLVSGSLGTFAVLRKQSLLGDAISHAALPGVAVAFLVSGSKDPWVILIGALIAGLLGTFAMMGISTFTRLKQDAALGIVLSVFFGFGVVLLTLIQRLPIPDKAGLNTYLFGNAATLLPEDVRIMAILSVAVLCLLLLFWKEMTCLSFDPEFCVSQGYSRLAIESLLTTLLVVSIVIGLQAVGVVLMSALVIGPAAAARQWTDKLSVMVVLAACFGAISGVFGALLSSSIDHLPTGPTIVLVLSLVVMVSLFGAPNRGLFWSWYRHRRHRKTLKAETILHSLWFLAQSHEDPYYQHHLSSLRAVGTAGMQSTMLQLEGAGLVQSDQEDCWGLTEKGITHVQQRFGDS